MYISVVFEQKIGQNHASCIRLETFAIIPADQSESKQRECLIVTELCRMFLTCSPLRLCIRLAHFYVKASTVPNIVNKRQNGLEANEIAYIFKPIASLVAFLHANDPPIMHRDIKVSPDDLYFLLRHQFGK